MANFILLSMLQAVLFGITCVSIKHLKVSFLATLGIFVIALGINYFCMPTFLLWNFLGLWVETFIILGLGLNLYFRLNQYKKSRNIEILRFIPLAIILILFISTTVNRAENFETNYTIYSINKRNNASEEKAKKIAEDFLNSNKELSSKVHIGNLSSQIISGRFTIDNNQTLNFKKTPIWIAPLEHNSFYDWLVNKTTPGYVIIDILNNYKCYLVTKINNQPLHLKYIETACLNNNLERHITINGYYKRNTFTNQEFKITSNGFPYWNLSECEASYFYNSDKKNINIDAQTGKIFDNTTSIEKFQWYLFKDDTFIAKN